MKYTDEQQDSIDAARRGESFVIYALAGTGKTSNLKGIAEALPSNRILYVGFSKSVCEEAKRRMPGNTVAKTYHGLAYGGFGYRYKDRIETSTWALKSAIEEFLRSDLSGSSQDLNTRLRYLYAVMDTLGRYQNSADRNILVSHVPEVFHDELNAEYVVKMALKVWEDMIDVNGKLPISHDTYGKGWQLTDPVLRYDLIAFDEAQDGSPVMLDVVEKQRNQKIFVGDSHQQIYAWRGAVNALDSINLQQHYLTQSFRFGPKIAQIANLILKSKGASVLVRGMKDKDDSVVVNQLGRPNAFLSRTNGGLVEQAISYIESGYKVGIVGGADRIMGMAYGAYELRLKGKSNHPAFRNFKSWPELQEAAKSEQGGNLKPFVQIVERYKERFPYIATLVKTKSVDPSEAQVVMATSHIFKGNEAEEVKIAGDYPLFCEFDKESKEFKFLEEEANLSYVTVTRAKKTLDLSAYAPILKESITSSMEMQKAAKQLRLKLSAA